ncbi:MAG: Gmad2 immunoglobulin-like domain-containing protein [Candidatus Pacebacteria bacterium]|nr:Gmad2 immunoglobulin-like domain-containing protein [Candidatus Paceibacterota bacterium]
MNKIIFSLIVVLFLIGFSFLLFYSFEKEEEKVEVDSFEECVEAGNPVMESYPRQCIHEGEKFVEDIGNEVEKTDLIQLHSVQPDKKIESPLTITGEARGEWFFEAEFPVTLTWDGEVIAQGIATAEDDWMTSDFVPFESVITFSVSEEMVGEEGVLSLHKSNPSGLPENDDVLEVPVIFSETEEEED